jgi:hypothetical protein
MFFCLPQIKAEKADKGKAKQRFEDAVNRAITFCKQSGKGPDYHFVGAGKPIKGGKGAVQMVEDYQLSGFACYLNAQNGDASLTCRGLTQMAIVFSRDTATVWRGK